MSEKKEAPNYLKRASRLIRGAIGAGATSVEEIADITGYSKSTVPSYAKLCGIKLPGVRSVDTRLSREVRIDAIRKAINEGAKSAQEIAEKVGLAPVTVYLYARESDVELPTRNVSKIDGLRVVELIKHGETSFARIAKLMDVTPAAISGHMRHKKRRELYNLWKRNIRKAKEQKSEDRLRLQHTRARLISVLESRMLQLADEGGWACEKALSYTHSRGDYYSKGHIPFETLLRFFHRYYCALEQDRSVSMLKLTDGLDMSHISASRILKKMGLRSLCQNITKKRVLLTKEQKEAIKRGIDLDMSSVDMGYFLCIPGYTVSQTFSRLGKKAVGHRSGIKPLGAGGRIVTYRLASQVYEAHDEEFTMGETCEFLGINANMYNYILDHREDLEEKIVGALRVLYADETIDQPYWTPDLKLPS